MPIDDYKIYEPFEKCKGLRKKLDRENGGWYDPWITEGGSYAYKVAGFENIYVFYNSEEDRVYWIQEFKDNGTIRIKKGVKVWESMSQSNQKLFLFNIDWFLGE
jgi:hypothetical protein